MSPQRLDEARDLFGDKSQVLNMSPELEELLRSTFILRQNLSKILPPEAVDYILRLIVEDGAHRKYLKLTEDTTAE